MQCPRCKADLTRESDACARCGLDLRLIRAIDGLQSDLEKTRAEHIRLEGKSRALHSLITETLAGIPRPQAREPMSSEKAAADSTTEWQSVDAVIPKPLEPTAVGEVVRSEITRKLKAEPLSEVLFGQKWMLIGGIVIMVLGIGYFLKYSFDRNWIGPEARVALTYLAGASLLGFGELFRRRSLKHFGLSLSGGGVATLYFASFAAFQIYHLFSQPVSFALMLMVTLLAGGLSLRHDTMWLSVLGLIGGFITPVVLSASRDNQVALMTYMAILNGGILWIATFKRWRLLSALGFLSTWLLFAAWFGAHYRLEKFWTTTFYLNFFYLIYFLAPIAYYFFRVEEGRIPAPWIPALDAFIAFGYSFAMIFEYARDVRYVSIASLAYAAVAFGLTYLLYKRKRENVTTLVILLAQGALFLVITVPLLFTKHWITIFWAIQACALLWAALRLTDRWLLAGALGLLAAAAGKLFLHDYVDVFQWNLERMQFNVRFTDFLLERLFTAGAVLSSLQWCAARLKRSGEKVSNHASGAVKALLVAFASLLFVLLNIEVLAFFGEHAPRARFASVSVLWTLFATVTLALGFLKSSLSLRLSAISIFLFTALKVFFVDMQNVEVPFRIVSFIVLGVMLIGASYLYHRYKDRILPTEPPSSATP